MIRAAGAVIALAGACAAGAAAVAGQPGGYLVLLVCALVLWFVGTTTAAGCVAPARPVAGAAAGLAAVAAWTMFFSPGAAAVAGVVVLVAGLAITAFPDAGRA